MEKVVDSCKEYGGKWSGFTFHKVRHGALVFQDDELAQVLKALRRGSSKDKKLAHRAFLMLTGFSKCPECGRLAAHHVYTDKNQEKWHCEKCHLTGRLKRGWSISKSDAVKNFTREEYEELCMQAKSGKKELLACADEFYGKHSRQ